MAGAQSQLSPLRDKGYLTHFNGTDIVERPITVVGTSIATFERLTGNETYRDVFFDAPLDELADFSSEWPNPNRAQDPTRGQDHNIPGQDGTSAESQSNREVRAYMPRGDGGRDRRFGTSRDLSDDTYNHFNIYYASVSFTKSIGHIWGSRLTQKQLQMIRSQIRGAHQRRLKVRYWGLPQWPVGLRNHIWHILVRENPDILSIDDLYGATRTDWRRRRSWHS